MGAGRETQDIFFYIKKKDFKRMFYYIKHFNRITYDDTFMPLLCKVIGHKPYQPDAKYEPDEWACRRCHRYIKYNPRKEKLKKLNKIK